ncbi:MAG: nitrogenase stabilizing/protective protein NifW [Pseudomonadota bacterium]
MGVLDELKRLSTAEDFFSYLAVDFEPRVLHVARLHILKRMGQYLAEETAASGSDDELRERCKQLLQTAYNDFVQRSPIEERIFKVHKDAVRQKAPKQKQLVKLQPLKKD